MNSRTVRGVATTGVVLAFAVRLGVVLHSRHSYRPVIDSADFNRIAISLARGRGFGATILPGAYGPSAFRTPLFPFLLSLVYRVFGIHLLTARVFMAVLSTAAVVGIAALGWRLGGRRVGLTALYLAAVYPPLVMAGYGLNYEVLYLTFECASLVLLLDWRRNTERWWLLILSGVMIGLTVLCRETGGWLLACGALVIAGSRSGLTRPGVVGAILTLALVATLVVLPWTVRNGFTMHAFIPVSDSPGVALAGEYNATTARDPSQLAAWIPPWYDPADAHRLSRLGGHPDEADYTSTLEGAGVGYLVAHPTFVRRVVVGNTARLFSLQGLAESDTVGRYIGWSARFVDASVIAFWVIGPLSVLGLFTARARRVPLGIWAFPALYFVTCVFTVSIFQYRAPMEPFFLIGTAMLIVALIERRSAGVPSVADDVRSAGAAGAEDSPL